MIAIALSIAIAMQGRQAESNPPGWDCDGYIRDRNGAMIGVYEPWIVYFDRHSTALTDDARAMIDMALRSFLPECRTLITGMRDATEAEDIALRRAEAVAAYMRARNYPLPIRVIASPHPPAQGPDADQHWARLVGIGTEPMP